MWVVCILFPVAANLYVAVRLPLRGEEMFYVTNGPVVLIAIMFLYCLFRLGLPAWWHTLAGVVLILLIAGLYVATFRGKIPSRIPVILACLAAIAILALDRAFRLWVTVNWEYGKWILLSDLFLFASVLAMALAAEKLPAPKEGEPRRLRAGDRYDGWQVHDNDAMNKLAIYFMPSRVGASNYIADSLECTNAERFIREMRKAGYKHFGMQHLFIASYVRGLCDYPNVNRFIQGQKVYAARQIVISMMIKKEMDVEGLETNIKVVFDPADTAIDVYNKFDAAVQAVKEPDENGFDKITQVIDLIPGILKKFVIWLLGFLDYFALLPDWLITNFSPFHSSMFITSMGSLGIPPIYHHLYDWGTVPVFCAFGNKYTKYEPNADGEIVAKKYIDYKWATDERTVDGYYYSRMLRKVRGYLMHPEKLNEPPEKIVPPRI